MIADDLIAAPRELRTPRLWLESPRQGHAGALMDSVNASLPELRFVSWAQERVDLRWAERFCDGGAYFVAGGEGLIFNAFEHAGGNYVGSIDLHTFDFATPRCEMGYVADVRHMGQGKMREAARAVLKLAFGLGIMRVEVISDQRNLRAARFALALGFRQEGVLHAHERDPKGALCDQVLLALLHPRLRNATGH